MKVIVCGLGNIAKRVIEQFISANETVAVISLGNQRVFEKSVLASCEKILEGDARDRDILIQAGINDADVIMALTGDDVINLEIAIIARELKPGIKIVNRMFDEVFSAKIQGGFGIHKALSASSLSASSFVSACLNKSMIHSFKFGNTIFFIAEETVTNETILAGSSIDEWEEKFGIKIIMSSGYSGGTPDKTYRPAINEKIIYLTSDRDIARDFREFSLADTAGNIIKKQIHTGKNFIEKVKSIPSHIRVTIIGYLSLLAVAVPVFHFGLNISVLDALYFTITTTTTVGYGDFNLQNAGPLVKIFGCFVMFGGAALIASIFSIITDMIISRRFSQFFGLRVKKLHDHVIVTGLGNIGYRVTNLLIESGEKIVAIEKNTESEFLSSIRGKIPVIFGSATQGDILAKAGAANARAIMALTDDDLVNLNILIDSKLTNPGIRTVARIFNRDIGEKAKEAFAIDSVLSTSQISAPTFAASAIHSDTVFAFNWEGHFFVMLDISTADHAWIHSQNTQLVRDGHNLYPLLIEKNGKAEFIHEGRSFTDKERILCIGLYEDIKKI